MAVFFMSATIDWKTRALRLRLTSMSENGSKRDASSCLRVLGVDPAAAGPTGYAIVERTNHGCRVLRYGAFKVATQRQKSSTGAVLQDVHSLLCDMILKFKPDVMAVESIFTALNVRTALRLAEVRGVVLLAGQQNGIEVRSYSPREVKACVTGYGHADKRQVQLMVRAQLGMQEMPIPSDAADALAVALCHLQRDQLERRFGVKAPEMAAKARAKKRANTGIQLAVQHSVRIQTDR
jgi:crossover junction endodeoxyribonuclease RuvC